MITENEKAPQIRVQLLPSPCHVSFVGPFFEEGGRGSINFDQKLKFQGFFQQRLPLSYFVIASCESFNTVSRESSCSVQKNSQIYLSEQIFSSFCWNIFLIHLTAAQNKLNMWYRKQAMQIQTEHPMNWFRKLQNQ